MKDMFYNYDHKIENLGINPILDCPNKKMNISTNKVEYMYNVLNKPIGIKANRNTTFTLYFNISGKIEGEFLEEAFKRNKVVFEILGAKDKVQVIDSENNKIVTKVVYTKEVQNTFKNGAFEVEISAKDDFLPFGLYTMSLTLYYSDPDTNNSEIIYPLFSNSEYYLNII